MNIDLRNNDCLIELTKLKDASIDCIVTSPPYWKGFADEAYFNSYAQYLRWSKRWMKECKRILKPNGTFYLNVINDSEIKNLFQKIEWIINPLTKRRIKIGGKTYIYLKICKITINIKKYMDYLV